MDQRGIESRPDVLVFSSAPLTEDTEVTGSVAARVFVSTAGRECDLAARLCDVYPDGRSILIAEGIQRVSRMARAAPGESLSGDASKLTTDQGDKELKAQEVTVSLGSTSMVFAKGHRIRLSLAGSNYPHWEVNGSNGAGQSSTAKQPTRKTTHITLQMGGQYPSRLLLPISIRAVVGMTPEVQREN